jgi:hypothetical protein
MRRILLTAGVWAVLGMAGSAQFAVDRKPTTPAAQPPAAGVTELLPYTPGGPAAAAVRPRTPPATAPAVPPPAPRTAHPLAVGPHHGEWLICVKSYAGPESLAFAERLAADVRRQHPEMPVYLFEYFSDERARLAAEQQRARQSAIDRKAPFLQKYMEEKAKAEKEGRTFLDDGPVKVRVPKLNTEVPEQWAVLVGGYKTNDQARKALDAVHKWAPPSDKTLMDKVTAMNRQSSADADKMVVDKVVDVNPYPTAMCVKNPSLPKAQREAPADPSLWKWNEGEPLSVLNCQKPYTLIVKAYTVPYVPLTADRDPSKLETLNQTQPGQANNAQRLAITAKQARDMALMLRGLKDSQGRSRGFETYVLHIETGSLVCVGQFDTEDDPTMVDTVQRLTNFSLKMSSDANAQQWVRPSEHSFFDQVSVLKIPRR